MVCDIFHYHRLAYNPLNLNDQMHMQNNYDLIGLIC